MIALAALCLAAALGVALLLLLVMARAFGWRRRRILTVARPWLLAIWTLLTVGLSAALANGVAAIEDRDVALAILWLATTMLVHAIDRGSARPVHPLRRWGGRVAHGGIAIVAGGIVLSSIFATTALRPMEPGDSTRFAAWTIQLHEVWPAAGEGWAGVAAELRVSSGDGVIVIEPEWRGRGDRSETAGRAISSSGSGLLTASIGPRDRDGRWPVELGWTPLLVLIPVGGAIAALGGALALVGAPVARWRGRRRARLATAWWA